MHRSGVWQPKIPQNALLHLRRSPTPSCTTWATKQTDRPVLLTTATAQNACILKKPTAYITAGNSPRQRPACCAHLPGKTMWQHLPGARRWPHISPQRGTHRHKVAGSSDLSRRLRLASAAVTAQCFQHPDTAGISCGCAHGPAGRHMPVHLPTKAAHHVQCRGLQGKAAKNTHCYYKRQPACGHMLSRPVTPAGASTNPGAPVLPTHTRLTCSSPHPAPRSPDVHRSREHHAGSQQTAFPRSFEGKAQGMTPLLHTACPAGTAAHREPCRHKGPKLCSAH